MIFHENRLADDFHEISYLIFYRKSQNLSSAAVVTKTCTITEAKFGEFKTWKTAEKSENHKIYLTWTKYSNQNDL